MTDRIENYTAHPDEWQVWLYKGHRSLLSFLIQGEDGWRRESGNHMDMRRGDAATGAMWPRVNVRDALVEARDRGVDIHAFAFASRGQIYNKLGMLLPDAEQQEFIGDYVAAQVGKPYDLETMGNRALRAIARLFGYNVPIIDLDGNLALICYELIARLLYQLAIGPARRAMTRNVFGRFVVDVDSFGPPDLWRLANEGSLIYRGRVVVDDPTHEV